MCHFGFWVLQDPYGQNARHAFVVQTFNIVDVDAGSKLFQIQFQLPNQSLHLCIGFQIGDDDLEMNLLKRVIIDL